MTLADVTTVHVIITERCFKIMQVNSMLNYPALLHHLSYRRFLSKYYTIQPFPLFPDRIMSGIEILGAVSAGFSVASTLGSCLHLLSVVLSARHAPNEIQDIITQFCIQRARFWLWCHDSGLLDSVVAQRNSQAIPVPEMMELFPPGLHSMIWSAVQTTLETLLRKIEQTQSSLDRYTIGRKDISLERNLTSEEIDLVASWEDALETVQSISNAKKLKWELKDKEQLSQLVGYIRQSVEDLEQLFGSRRAQHLERRLAAVIHTTALADSISNMASFSSPTIHPHDSTMARVQILQREASIRSLSADERSVPKQTHQCLRAINSSHAFNVLHLNLSQLHFDHSDTSPPVQRSNARVKQEPVIVEWRYYSQSMAQPEIELLHSRIHLLAIQLQQSSTLRGTRILKCLGHFHDSEHMRFGIVYQYPTGCELSTPMSLRTLLENDRRSRRRRDLEDRQRAAASLATTVQFLLSVGWLHKNICASNIIFFEEADVDNVRSNRLTDPFLCGFGLSRPDDIDQVTEALPSRLIHMVESMEYRLSSHPNRLKDQERSTNTASMSNYKRQYDIYSLGIILLEIGYWSPVTRIWKEIQGKSPSSTDPLQAGAELLQPFYDALQSSYIPGLRSRLGRPFANAVSSCLIRELGNMSDYPVVEKRQRCGKSERLRMRQDLLSFETSIVLPLQTFNGSELNK